MLDTGVISGEDVCCGVVFHTLVGVFVFSFMWSELLMTSAISCPLWSLVCECHKVECTFTSPVRTECVMFVMCCVVCSVVCLWLLFCSVWMCCLEEVYRCLLLFSVVNVYLDHLKLCGVCINSRRYVYCGECYVVSNEVPCATYRCALL